MPLLGPRNDDVEDRVGASVGCRVDYLHRLRSTVVGDFEVVAGGDVVVVDLPGVQQDLDVVFLVQTVQLLGNSSISRTGAIVGYNTAISNLYRYAAIWPPNTYQLVEELLSPRETTIRQSALPELTGKAPSKQ